MAFNEKLCSTIATISKVKDRLKQPPLETIALIGLKILYCDRNSFLGMISGEPLFQLIYFLTEGDNCFGNFVGSVKHPT